MDQNKIHIILPVNEQEHTHTIVFLHGRDSTAPEFAEEFFESQASDDRTLPEILPTIKWVFPTSKIRTSARFETEMSQWFDMWSVEDPEERKELQMEGLKESIESISDIIRSEAAVVGHDRIILGGISQGCATSILALLSGGTRLGGFIGLCSWLPFGEEIMDIARRSACSTTRLHELWALFRLEPESYDLEPSGLDTPVFLSHSKDDDVVPIANGERISRGLRQLGMGVTWKMYEDGGHWVNEPQGVDDIVDFITGFIMIDA